MRRHFVAPGGLPLKSNGDPSATRPRTRNATPCSSDYAPLARREVMNDEIPGASCHSDFVPIRRALPCDSRIGVTFADVFSSRRVQSGAMNLGGLGFHDDFETSGAASDSFQPSARDVAAGWDGARVSGDADHLDVSMRTALGGLKHLLQPMKLVEV